MMVNGEPKLTCATFLADYAPGPVRVEPLRNFPVIRDLIVDIGDFMRKLSRVKPWIVRKEREAALGGRVLVRRRRSWTSTSSSACASTACCATRPVRSTASTRTSSGRRRSRWPSAITSTHATKAPRSAWRSSRSTRESGAALRRGVHGGVPQARRSGRSDPALQAHRCRGVAEGVLHATRGVMSQNPDYTPYHPRWLRPPMSTYGGSASGPISGSSCAKTACMSVMWGVVYMLLLANAVSRGPGSYAQFIEWSATPWVLTLNVVSFLLVAYHAVTFSRPRQAIVVHVGRRRVPAHLVMVGHYVAWRWYQYSSSGYSKSTAAHGFMFCRQRATR